MRLINLLNKIANEEKVPKEIKYKLHIWKHDNDMEDYYWEDYKDTHWLTNEYHRLNDEIEIIEEPKKIERIGNDYYHKNQDRINEIFQRKINEIIDYINKGDSND